MSTRPKAAKKRKNNVSLLFKMSLQAKTEPDHAPFSEYPLLDAHRPRYAAQKACILKRPIQPPWPHHFALPPSEIHICWTEAAGISRSPLFGTEPSDRNTQYPRILCRKSWHLPPQHKLASGRSSPEAGLRLQPAPLQPLLA